MPQGLRAGHLTRWESFGRGPRAALLLHCSLARLEAWGGVAERLADRLTMTAFDEPGHGRSADWDGAGDYQEATTRIAESFCAGPTDLIGHSFGATVALRLALERPGLARSLVLVEPVFFAAARAAGDPEYGRYLARMGPFQAAMEAGDREAAARHFTAVWGGAPWERLGEAQRGYIAARIHLIAASVPGLFKDSGDMLAPGRLEALDVPVLLIEGGASDPIVPAVLDALEARLANVRRVRIADAGHMVAISHAAEVAGAIAAFLDDAP